MRIPSKVDKLLGVLPRPWVRGLRNLVLRGMDARDRVAAGGELRPPRSLHFVGGGDFQAIGEAFVGHFTRVCGLRGEERVLDIGCGTGRMAIPLLKLLGDTGSYVGFDISRGAIDWCNQNIASRNGRFSFVHADLRNSEYNPHGTVAAAEYRFPCDDQSIDFAFATSVFTHMRANEVAHYLREIRRVLTPSGRAMLTFFVLDAISRSGMAAGKAVMVFDADLGDCLTIDAKTPERAIAYAEPQLAALLEGSGLRLAKPIFFGSWSGRHSMLDSQDAVVVTPA